VERCNFNISMVKVRVFWDDFCQLFMCKPHDLLTIITDNVDGWTSLSQNGNLVYSNISLNCSWDQIKKWVFVVLDFYIYIYIYIYIYAYFYIYLCVSVCVCMHVFLYKEFGVIFIATCADKVGSYTKTCYKNCNRNE